MRILVLFMFGIVLAGAARAETTVYSNQDMLTQGQYTIRAGDQIELTRFERMQVQNANPVSHERHRFLIGDWCAIEAGGSLRVIGFPTEKQVRVIYQGLEYPTDDQLQARYSRLGRNIWALCPSGTEFFVSPTRFVSTHLIEEPEEQD